MQLPPGQVKVQSARSSQVMSHPPPAQSELQLESPRQFSLQKPPGQACSQLLESSQVRLQLAPLLQVVWQSAEPVQPSSQGPPVHVCVH